MQNYSLSEFLQTFGNNADTQFNGVLGKLGIDPASMYRYEDNQQVIDPAIAQRYAGYTVSRGDGTPGQNEAFTVRDAGGNSVGGGSQYISKDSGLEKFMYNGGALAIALGGGALLNSMGVGGAGAAGAATPAASSVTPAAFNAAADSAAAYSLPEVASISPGVTAATAPAIPTASSGLGGLLANSGGVIGDAASWLKNNPALGKAIFSAGTGLLSASGGSGGSAGGTPTPVQWNSPVRPSGLLGASAQPAQQVTVPQLAKTGNANSGAWRFLG